LIFTKLSKNQVANYNYSINRCKNTIT